MSERAYGQHKEEEKMLPYRGRIMSELLFGNLWTFRQYVSYTGMNGSWTIVNKYVDSAIKD